HASPACPPSYRRTGAALAGAVQVFSDSAGRALSHGVSICGGQRLPGAAGRPGRGVAVVQFVGGRQSAGVGQAAVGGTGSRGSEAVPGLAESGKVKLAWSRAV